MKYMMERYKNCERFNEQYEGIYRFLLEGEMMEWKQDGFLSMKLKTYSQSTLHTPLRTKCEEECI